MIESFSKAGKLTGNGIEYFGATLIRSDLACKFEIWRADIYENADGKD